MAGIRELGTKFTSWKHFETTINRGFSVFTLFYIPWKSRKDGNLLG